LKTGLPSPVSQGSLQFLGQYYSEQDLRQYLTSLGIPYKPFKNNHIYGINNQSNPGDETMLDIEQMTSINPLAENWYFNYDTKNMSGENFYTTVLKLNELDDLPQVLSISYGDPETGLCTYVTDCDKKVLNTAKKYIDRTNLEFMILTMRGITVLVASGDDGANNHYADCTNKMFYPDYPTASPFVTSVGATALVNITYKALQHPPSICFNSTITSGCASGGQEVAVDITEDGFTSGGGFSSVSAQPSYQKQAVNQYFQNKRCNNSKISTHYPPSSMYNRHGRAYPDVAAFGTSGYTVCNGIPSLAGGTSMSSPLWAGIISILNSYSINITGQTLGFLNPLLYKMAKECPKCFNDITVGNNKCTENVCTNQCKGFQAACGWDPVTGLGSPNVGEMLQYITNLLKKKIKKQKTLER
jgi:tripeptidyl-peptidase-1